MLWDNYENSYSCLRNYQIDNLQGLACKILYGDYKGNETVQVCSAKWTEMVVWKRDKERLLQPY